MASCDPPKGEPLSAWQREMLLEALEELVEPVLPVLPILTEDDDDFVLVDDSDIKGFEIIKSGTRHDGINHQLSKLANSNISDYVMVSFAGAVYILYGCMLYSILPGGTMAITGRILRDIIMAHATVPAYTAVPIGPILLMRL